MKQLKEIRVSARCLDSIAAHDFLRSALTEQSSFLSTEQVLAWFQGRKEVHRFQLEMIPFREMDRWNVENTSGNLVHVSGSFFRIEGIWVETNYGDKPQWSQPIINQPEIGILGIMAKEFHGILHFLMQAKMEPGNIDMIQLAPTLQATRSNFTRVHKGKAPPYLDYFLDHPGARVRVDILQSEQGARFLRKRNRNMIVHVLEEVPVYDDYCWMTLGQINQISKRDNLVNMDARTVLSCIPYHEELGPAGEVSETELDRMLANRAGKLDAFKLDLLSSAVRKDKALHTAGEIIGWFTRLKFKYKLDVERIPLKYVQEWHKTEYEIVHNQGKFFSVIAVRVQADNREVPAWTQPLVKPREPGLVAFLMKNFDGVCHFLVQGKVEPGNFDVVEMAPTVQCLTGNYREVPKDEWPGFVDYVLSSGAEQVRYRAMQSEEGGRFFRETNLNMVVEVDESFPSTLPEEFLWLSLNQLKEFIRFNNFVNVQARCLLACLGFI